MALTWLVGFCLAGSWNGGVLEWQEGDRWSFDWRVLPQGIMLGGRMTVGFLLAGFCLAGYWKWREDDWRIFACQGFAWWDFAWRRYALWEDDWRDFELAGG